jgi:hypothetical protein
LIRRLAAAHDLRTLDALQPAVALDLHTQGLVSQFLSTDYSLCALAATGACPLIGDSAFAVANVVWPLVQPATAEYPDHQARRGCRSETPGRSLPLARPTAVRVAA